VANGDEWKKQRKVMNPAFRIQVLKAFTDGFIEKVMLLLHYILIIKLSVIDRSHHLFETDSSFFGYC